MFVKATALWRNYTVAVTDVLLCAHSHMYTFSWQTRTVSSHFYTMSSILGYCQGKILLILD